MKLIIIAALLMSVALSAKLHRVTHTVRIHPKTRAAKVSNNGVDGVPVIQINYRDRVEEVGWLYIDVTRTGNCPLPPESAELWYAAGYGEGYVSQGRIAEFYNNAVKPWNTTEYLTPQVVSWVHAHIDWMVGHSQKLAPVSHYWTLVNNTLAQLQGVADGYAQAAPHDAPPLTLFDFFLMNFQFELWDIIRMFNASTTSAMPSFMRQGGCSAFVAPTSDNLYVGHTTWSSYTKMLKFYKVYDFAGAKPVMVQFSGYPGLIHSGEDFYQNSKGIVAVETTNPIFDMTLFREFVVPETVSEFIRVMVANHIASDGASWVETFCRNNNGLYNNQWVVVDFNKFRGGLNASQFKDGTVWIAEPLPGMCPTLDVTPIVRQQGYWASYNIPFFPTIQQLSGVTAMEELYGDYFSHSRTARARIFAREIPNAVDAGSMMRLIRLNTYETDPLSRVPGGAASPMLTIAARGDLVNPKANYGNWTPFITANKQPFPGGAIDGKVASWQNFLNGTTNVIAGPTYTNVAPFMWSVSPVNSTPHVGQPNLQLFPWIDSNTLANGN